MSRHKGPIRGGKEACLGGRGLILAGKALIFSSKDAILEGQAFGLGGFASIHRGKRL